ncbi:Hypothetical predicted protein [Octopus vulgaris]|uniref:Uncharacterized protein n=1 Tax=Octopus vulgaris TaxID=6645 RepID=A0AA36AMR7_OCTVU|nr:Hypothetical predicted protein [Octopus vulgaris]
MPGRLRKFFNCVATFFKCSKRCKHDIQLDEDEAIESADVCCMIPEPKIETYNPTVIYCSPRNTLGLQGKPNSVFHDKYDKCESFVQSIRWLNIKSFEDSENISETDLCEIITPDQWKPENDMRFRYGHQITLMDPIISLMRSVLEMLRRR